MASLRKVTFANSVCFTNSVNIAYLLVHLPACEQKERDERLERIQHKSIVVSYRHPVIAPFVPSYTIGCRSKISMLSEISCFGFDIKIRNLLYQSFCKILGKQLISALTSIL
jgi:hypothetical protein